MKLCNLKIEKRFFEDISSHKKRLEVRKADKKYIRAFDIIRYIDIETGKELGFASVKNTHEINKEDLIYYTTHIPTLKFVDKYYKSEDKLFVASIRYMREV